MVYSNIRAGIYKKFVKKASKEDFDQTASSESDWSGSALFVEAFLAGSSEIILNFHKEDVLPFSVIIKGEFAPHNSR